MLKLKLHSIAYPVTALGVGKRVVLWVSGCSLNCKGCISPELQTTHKAKEISIDSLSTHLLALTTELDGITLSGGEPFEQAEGLTALLITLKQKRPAWDVLAFSGYSLAYLQGMKKTNDLLAQIDSLVDGVYQQNNVGKHPLTASANQRIHYLTQRGEALAPAYDSLAMNHANLAIGTDPTQRLVGIIRPHERRQIHQKLSLNQPS
ncbi:MAG: 4Fe-4S single cluster domain-containing protein [Methylococcales bacterium]|nr:4Fe-4S single cluster domain-containing protein [Methylococcales bacterium]